MRRIFVFTVFLLSAFAVFPQMIPSPTVDVTSNAEDAANSSSRKREKEALNETLEFINKWSDRINAAMDTVNTYMNKAGTYIATAREVRKAASDVAEVIGIYQSFVDDISSCQALQPSQRLGYINRIINEVQGMQTNFNKIKSVAGVGGKDGGHMNDGARLNLIRRYAAYVSQTCASVKRIYYDALGGCDYNRYSGGVYDASMNALGGF